MHKKIVPIILLSVVFEASLQCSWFTNKQKPDTECIVGMKKVSYNKTQNKIYGNNDEQSMVDYLNYGITRDEVKKTDMSHQVKRSLRKMLAIEEGFKLTGVDFNDFFKKNVPSEYNDTTDIQDAMIKPHEEAINTIKTGIEPQLSQILIEGINNSNEKLESLYVDHKNILEYVKTHKEFLFQVPEVVECMINRFNKFTPSVVSFLLKNIRFINPVTNINKKYTTYSFINSLVITQTNCPLQAAIDNMNLKAIKLLLTAGADPNSQSIKTENNPLEETQKTISYSILESAICYKNAELVQLLLEFGANPNSQTLNTIINPATQAETATSYPILQSAIYSQNAEIVKLLLKFGADINQTIKIKRNGNITNEIKILELTHAIDCNIEIMELLLEAQLKQS